MRSFVAVLLAAFMVALSFVPTYDIFFHYSVDENCGRCGRFNYGTVKREMYLYNYDDGRHVYEKVIEMFCVHCGSHAYESTRRLEEHRFYSIDLGCNDGSHGFVIACRVCRNESSYKYMIECDGQPHIRMTKAGIDFILESNPWREPNAED